MARPSWLLAAAAAAAALLARRRRRRRARSRALERRLLELLEEVEARLAVPPRALAAARDALAAQMAAGLAGAPGGLMMIPTFVDAAALPTGRERGEVLAADLGGTNLRVLSLRFGGSAADGAVGDDTTSASASAPAASSDGHRVLALREWPTPDACFDTADSARALMDWVAARVLEVAPGAAGPGAPGAPPPALGLCFSFALAQTALDAGRLLTWTKQFRGAGLVGEDVPAALRAALARAGAPRLRLRAVVNDTVAALAAARGAAPGAAAAVILGTGTNAAYLERRDALAARLPPTGGGAASESTADADTGLLMAVNTEWGDADVSADAFCRLEEDLWVDAASPNPGRGRFEKLVAGLYMGEVARRVLARLAAAGGLFGGGARAPGLARAGALGGAAFAAAAADASPGLDAAGAAAAAAFGAATTSAAEREAVRRVCRAVARRSARLVAAALAAVLARAAAAVPGAAADAPVVVGVDGSVFSKFPLHGELLREALGELLGAEAAARVELRLVENGSVMGAALVAAAAAAHEEEEAEAAAAAGAVAAAGEA
jgi:hexokinase